MLDLRTLHRALGGEVNGGHLLCPGPGHSTADRSLSIKLDGTAPDGFLVHSFAGDDPITCKDYVREKLGLPAFKPNGGNGRRRASDDAIERALMAAVQGNADNRPKGCVVATYNYTDADGTLLYQVLRLDPKSFRQRKPDGNGGWRWELGDVRRVAYRWPELLKYPDAAVFVCEGEKDADRVASLGHCATTVAGNKWTDDCVKALTGRDVVVLQDNDRPGRENAVTAAQALHGAAKSVRVVLLPDLPDKGDVSDWLDADPRRAEKLVDICFNTPTWEPGSDTDKESNPGCHETKDDAEQPEQEQKSALPFIQTSKQFVADFRPPDYLVDGLLQEGFLYALTGVTGSGKTSITLRLAASIALCILFAGRETKKRRVLYLAAENPDDVRMRWIALSQYMNFDIETIEVFFIKGVFKISKMKQRLQEEANKLGGDFGLVVLDTSPAFYEGDDENSRTQQGHHAEMLRELIKVIPGKPAVIANCHPTKNATPDNLLPAGGGNFLNQIDGNLTAAKTESTTELHTQGKFRGVEFAPTHFLIKTVTDPRVKDSRERLVPTVICEWISDEAKEAIAAQKVRDEDAVLKIINDEPKASQSTIAIRMGWKMHNGEPHKVKAGRCIKALKADKLISETRRGRYQLSEKGKEVLQKGDKE